MGYYLNPGNKGFREAVRSKIYVDKTNLIAFTNELINTQENIFVSADQGALENQWHLKCLLPIIAAAAILRNCFRRER